MVQQVKVAKPGGKTKEVSLISSQDKVIDLGDKEFQWSWIF